MQYHKINDLCDVVRGSSPRPKGDPRYYGGEIPRLMVADLTRDGMYVTPILDNLTKEGAKKSRAMKKGDLVVAVSGNPGEPCILNVDCCIHDGFVGLRNLNIDLVYTPFLYQYFKFFKEINKSHAVGAIYKNLNTDQIKKISIPLPPLPTQKKIATILDEADTLRQLNKTLIAKYDALTQSLFLDMFGDPVTNPMGFDVRNLGEITLLVTDGKHGNCNDEKGSGYYFISAKDIRNDKINYTNSREIPKKEFEEVDKRTNLQSGDLVMINTGATIGRMAIAENIPETRKSTFQKSVAVIKVKKEIISSIFLKYVFELRLDTFASKGSGSAIKNLLLSEMRKFKIIVPPINLQNQFAERVAIIEQQKAQAQQSLQKSEDLFNSLLQKAFKGELVH